jgi:hypothetical protein
MSRRVDAVVSQPRSRPPSPQLDVAGTPGEGLPRRFRDTNDRPACSDKVCGAPIFSAATILNRGKRLAIHRGRGEAPAIDHQGSAVASSHRPDGADTQAFGSVTPC